MKKHYLSLALGILISCFLSTYAFVYFLTMPQYVQPLQKSAQQLLIIVNTCHGSVGGAEMHSLNLAQQLATNGYHVAFFAAHNSKLAAQATALHIPLITTRAHWLWHHKNLFRWALAGALASVANTYPSVIFQCSTERAAQAALMAKTTSACHVILERHNPEPLRHPNLLASIDAMIGVSKAITGYLVDVNQAHHLGAHTVINIPPFFDQDRCNNFVPTHTTREAFFLHTFDTVIKPSTFIITSIGHMHDTNKNQDLVLQAAHELLHNQHIPVQIVLVGNGKRRTTLQQMAKRLHIDEHVLFTGFYPRPQEILYYSDAHILASKAEAFGVVHLEAGLMGKPTLGATGTSADEIIIRNKTGMLFKNNNADDLAAKIAWLAQHRDKTRKMGARARKHVLRHFGNESKLQKLSALYAKLGLKPVTAPPPQQPPQV